MAENTVNKVQHYPCGTLNFKSDDSGSKMWTVALEKTMLNYFEVPPDCRFEKHHHESEQITFIIEGEIFFEVNGGTICVKKGEVIAIPSNVAHAVFTTATAVKAVVALSPLLEKYK